MRILITGSAGFIGFHLNRRLLAEGHTVVGVDNFNDYYDVKLKRDRDKILHRFENFTLNENDICKLDDMKRVFYSGFDAVVNLAAQAGVRYSIENPHAFIETNVMGFTNILECAKNAGVENFIYASSSSVYGKHSIQPSNEEHNVMAPCSLYAATKVSNEAIAFSYHDMFGINCTGLRFFTVYGPWGRPDMALQLFADGIVRGNHIDVYNYGDMYRDFTYIDDIVNGIVACIYKKYKFEIFNLGSGVKVPLMKYISYLESELGIVAQKRMLPMQRGDVKKSLADIRHAKKMLDYKPTTYVKEGIKKYVEWYKEYYGV